MKPAKTLHFIWESHKGLFNFIVTKLPVMLKLTLFLFVIVASVTIYTQIPEIAWQNTIGGINSDVINEIHQTTDGGYIIGGYSESGASGDKTESKIGKADYWIIKLDIFGNIEWQNTIGGTKEDYLKSVEQTSDGGYIIGGQSLSEISGDKTENNKGGSDIWILKLDAAGNILWQNNIGCFGEDILHDIKQTTDGGYIIGANSSSGLCVDKNETPFGGHDFWIIKIDATGNIIWQNSIGGSGYDELRSIIQTSDGGYLASGHSDSNISGDKTENSNGTADYWIIKLNAIGIVEWQNTIGGNSYDYLYDVKQTPDDGYILGGWSSSSISGDKTEDNVAALVYPSSSDYWIVKVDVSGNIEWQNTIGGDNYDRLFSIDLTYDGGYVLGGHSDSNISGDKSENRIGLGPDFWIIKLDNSGAIEWENSIGGDDNDQVGAIEQTADNGFIIGGYSSSEISEDKTEENVGNFLSTDYWIVKLSPEICVIPTDVYADNITPVKATINWNLIPGADSYQIWYRAEGVATWIKKSSTTNSKILKSLSPETTYQYKVRTKCDNFFFSEFSAVQNFTTLPLRTAIDIKNVEIVIYPNPNSGIFTITAPLITSEASVQIFNSLGQQIYTQQLNTLNGKINELITLNNLSLGLYFIRITQENFYSEQKFVVE